MISHKGKIPQYYKVKNEEIDKLPENALKTILKSSQKQIIKIK